MISFRSMAISASFFLAALVGISLLAYDSPLRVTPNVHWDFVLVLVVVDAMLGMQVALTAELHQWENQVVRATAFWSVLVVAAIIGDVAFSLQLPSGYPPITELQAFEYLFLGLNGNPLPLAVPTLFTAHAVAAVLGLLPRKAPWYQLGIFPCRRTILVVALIILVVMGMRPTSILLASSGMVPNTPSALNSTQIIQIPVTHHNLPYNIQNRTVFVTLVAAVNPMLPYNYNNTRMGQMVIYVPANWTVRLVFVNREGFPHSAVLMEATGASPITIDSSDHILAQIPKDALNGGFLLQNETGSATINNISPGNYWIVCAFQYPVPHAEEGMWVTLEVTNQTTTPYYVVLPG
ncbi:MAG TPA: sulfocyanin-like copper-binding protein [Terriglobales bacterium]|nr:sulfocyanin-like copper-binding protein [Terriglobales bacterium]